MFDAIKLGLSMLVEFCLDKKMLVAILAVLVILPWLMGLFASVNDFQDAFGWALLFGLGCGLVAFFIAPSFFSSSFKEINYAMDWLFHVISCTGVTLYATVVVWPLIALII